MTTRAEARDAILTQFSTEWATLTTPPALFYDDVTGDLPPATSPWARVNIQNVFGEQTSLGEAGARIFEHSGIVTVQIFTPVGDGLDLSDTLVEKALDAFEGRSTSGIWYKNARAVDIGEDGDWYQVNIKSDFTYRRVK